MNETSYIHPTALVEEGATLGQNVKIWHMCQVRGSAVLGNDISIGKDSYIDANVHIGCGSRIQNHVNIYDGVKIGKSCFVGPAVVFTNDQFPRVGNKTWEKLDTIVENGASIGAGAVIRCGITLGGFSMIGAGAIVTRDVSPFTLVLGFPADKRKHICACGQTVLPIDAPKSEYFRKCCKENMSDFSKKLALETIGRL
jgi:UDP-2-acetamido-3-amino-2,3-dideoxy-glucuronate N-acetyltransferase